MYCWQWEKISVLIFFFFNDTATTEIYTLSLHDALPISKTLPFLRHAGTALVLLLSRIRPVFLVLDGRLPETPTRVSDSDRKSTRLNSSHANISYAVFCLKKKNIISTVFYSSPSVLLLHS